MAAPITALPQPSPFQPPVGLQAQQPFNPLQNIQGPALPPEAMPAPTIDLNAPIVDKFDPAQAQGTKSMGEEMALPLPQQLSGQPVPQPQFGLAEAPAAPAAAPQTPPNLGPAKPAQNPAGQQDPMSKEDAAALNELLAAGCCFCGPAAGPCGPG